MSAQLLAPHLQQAILRMRGLSNGQRCLLAVPSYLCHERAPRTIEVYDRSLNNLAGLLGQQKITAFKQYVLHRVHNLWSQSSKACDVATRREAFSLMRDLLVTESFRQPYEHYIHARDEDSAAVLRDYALQVAQRLRTASNARPYTFLPHLLGQMRSLADKLASRRWQERAIAQLGALPLTARTFAGTDFGVAQHTEVEVEVETEVEVAQNIALQPLTQREFYRDRPIAKLATPPRLSSASEAFWGHFACAQTFPRGRVFDNGFYIRNNLVRTFSDLVLELIHQDHKPCYFFALIEQPTSEVPMRRTVALSLLDAEHFLQEMTAAEKQTVMPSVVPHAMLKETPSKIIRRSIGLHDRHGQLVAHRAGCGGEASTFRDELWLLQALVQVKLLNTGDEAAQIDWSAREARALDQWLAAEDARDPYEGAKRRRFAPGGAPDVEGDARKFPDEGGLLKHLPSRQGEPLSALTDGSEAHFIGIRQDLIAPQQAG